MMTKKRSFYLELKWVGFFFLLRRDKMRQNNYLVVEIVERWGSWW